MSNILYITVSPKEESISISKKLGRVFIEKYKELHPEAVIESLDLYSSDIPELSPRYLYDAVYLKKPNQHPELTKNEIQMIERIDELSDQFLKADIYVIATPMWSLSFPARLKRYIDCICLGGRVLDFSDKKEKPNPLLNDKERAMIYLETCGGDFPFFTEGFMHQGSKYCKQLFKGLGIKRFDHIYVEGAVAYKEQPEKFLDKAYREINNLVESL